MKSRRDAIRDALAVHYGASDVVTEKIADVAEQAVQEWEAGEREAAKLDLDDPSVDCVDPRWVSTHPQTPDTT